MDQYLNKLWLFSKYDGFRLPQVNHKHFIHLMEKELDANDITIDDDKAYSVVWGLFKEWYKLMQDTFFILYRDLKDPTLRFYENIPSFAKEIFEEALTNMENYEDDNNVVNYEEYFKDVLFVRCSGNTQSKIRYIIDVIDQLDELLYKDGEFQMLFSIENDSKTCISSGKRISNMIGEVYVSLNVYNELLRYHNTADKINFRHNGRDFFDKHLSNSIDTDLKDDECKINGLIIPLKNSRGYIENFYKENKIKI